MAELQFPKGMEVEVCSTTDAVLTGAWFPAAVLPSASKNNKVFVEYTTLTTSDVTGSKPLRELVDLGNLRPVPPREPDRSFQLSDEVDAYHNDGWWDGVVVRVVADGQRYLVYFRPGKAEIEFGKSQLRVHREWVNGSWVPPLDDQAKPDQLQLQQQQQQEEEEEQNKDTTCDQVDVNRSDQDPLSIVHENADIASESNKQKIKRPSPERNYTEISPPYKKYKNEEETKDSSLLGAHLEKAMPSSLAPMVDDTPLEQRLEISQYLTDAFSNPLEGLPDHLAPNIGPENVVNDSDCDWSMTHPTIDDIGLSSSNNGGEQCDMPKTLMSCLQKKPAIRSQPQSINKPDPQCRRMTTGWRCGEMAFPGKRYCEKHQLKHDIYREKMRNKQVEQSRGVMVPMEPFISSDDPQQCRRTRKLWRCMEMANPGKRYCEKHQVEQNIRNEKGKIVMEPFVPSDNQQCRRTGKGWRCSQRTSPGKRYCEKHQLEQNIHNEKRRNRPKERNSVVMEPFVPTEHHQCRRTGKGWRCPGIASPGQRYCEKHHLEQIRQNEKRRKKRKELTSSASSDSGERCNSNGLDHQQGVLMVIDEKSNQNDAGKGVQGHESQVDNIVVFAHPNRDERVSQYSNVVVASTESNGGNAGKNDQTYVLQGGNSAAGIEGNPGDAGKSDQAVVTTAPNQDDHANVSQFGNVVGASTRSSGGNAWKNDQTYVLQGENSTTGIEGNPGDAGTCDQAVVTNDPNQEDHMNVSQFGNLVVASAESNGGNAGEIDQTYELLGGNSVAGIEGNPGDAGKRDQAVVTTNPNQDDHVNVLKFGDVVVASTKSNGGNAGENDQMYELQRSSSAAAGIEGNPGNAGKSDQAVVTTNPNQNDHTNLSQFGNVAVASTESNGGNVEKSDHTYVLQGGKTVVCIEDNSGDAPKSGQVQLCQAGTTAVCTEPDQGDARETDQACIKLE